MAWMLLMRSKPSWTTNMKLSSGVVLLCVYVIYVYVYVIYVYLLCVYVIYVMFMYF